MKATKKPSDKKPKGMPIAIMIAVGKPKNASYAHSWWSYSD